MGVRSVCLHLSETLVDGHRVLGQNIARWSAAVLAILVREAHVAFCGIVVAFDSCRLL
jgi:hypothetical protein